MTARQNPFAYPKPITLDSLPNLFAHHRSGLSGWTMSTSPPEPDPKADPPKPDPPKASDPPAYTAPATQADLDRIVGERLARDRERFKDYDDLKAKAAAHDKALADAMTEQEKAVDAARKEGEQTASERANARLVKAEARALAAQAGFRSLTDVNLLDLSGVKVGDDGEVDSDAVKAALKTLSDAEPWRLDDGKKTVKADKSQGGGDSEKTSSVSVGRDLYASRRGKKAS